MLRVRLLYMSHAQLLVAEGRVLEAAALRMEVEVRLGARCLVGRVGAPSVVAEVVAGVDRPLRSVEAKGVTTRYV